MYRQENIPCKSYKAGKCKFDQDCLHIHPVEFAVLPKPNKILETGNCDAEKVPGTVEEEYEDIDITDDTKDECENEGEIVSETEVYEKQMKAAIERALGKSRCSRDVDFLAHMFREKVLTPFLVENFNDIMNIIVRYLRSGQEADIVSGASLSSAVILSVATYKESEKIYKSIHQVLNEIICDPSTSSKSKLKCSTTLATACFLACTNVDELKNVCKSLQLLYVQSSPDEHEKSPPHTLDTYQSHIAAIHGHCLLMSIMSPSYVYKTCNDFMEIMFTLLRCNHLGIRIAAGEAIALVYEIAREANEDYSWSKENELSKALVELATDSQKFRSKKDRKEQRCTFREVIRYINERSISDDKIQIGPMLQRQDFSLNTWKLKCQYQALRNSLASGINAHLTFNVGLRNIYELGPPPEKLDRKERVNMRKNIKQQKRVNNICKEQEFKARNQRQTTIRASNSSIH